MPNQKRTHAVRRKEPPSWRDLIGLGLAAIFLMNLLGVTIVLLFGPTPPRIWVIGIVWIIAVIGLVLLAKVWRNSKPARTRGKSGDHRGN